MIHRAMAAFVGALILGATPAAQEPTPTPAPPPQAAAQEPAPTPPPAAATRRPEVTEEIVVTGSRLKRKDLTTPAPVAVFTHADIDESGYVSVGEFLQHRPEIINGMNRQVNNGGDGTLRANVRGLGPFRTLVLINGRRAPFGGLGADQAADLNAIPSAAVERIEVLKDGASPMYGSEAIGGVVNIITRKSWSGSELGAYGSTSSRGDGGQEDFRLALGRSSEDGNLLLTSGFTRTDPLWAGARGWAREIWAYDATGNNSPNRTIGPYRIGSSRGLEPRFRKPGRPGVPIPNPNGDPHIDLLNQLIAAYPDAQSFIRDAAAPLGWRGYRGAALPVDGGDGYNFQPENYLVTPTQALSLFVAGDAALGRLARGFVEVGYAGSQATQKLAPESFGTADTGSIVSASNLYNPFGVDLPIVVRRLPEFGHRTWSQDFQSIRAVGGLGGSILELPWSWEASANYGRSAAAQSHTGGIRLSSIQAAIGPSFTDGGAPRCGTKDGGAIPGCVPLNLFGAPGSITPDQVAGMTFDGTHRGTNEAEGGQLSVTGDLFPLLGERPVGLAAGYEFRRVSGSWVPDPIRAAGDSSDGLTFLPFSGSQHAHEGYAELSLPILSGKLLAERVEALAAARVFKYSGFGTDWTWKLGGRWSPLRGVTLRGTLSAAYRAPSIQELYFSQAAGLGSQADPCSGVNPDTGNPAPVSPHCAGTPNGDLVPSYTLSFTGNPEVRAETARIFTAGVVVEPTFLPQLSVTVDAWGVAIDNAIQNPDDAFILRSCYPMSPDATPRLCDLVQRDAKTGILTAIHSPALNLGNERMAGIDVAVRYAIPTPWGRFGVSFDGTRLQRYDVTLPDGTVVHGAGNYDLALLSAALAGAYPTYRFNAGVDWRSGGVGAAFQMRYIGSLKECGTADFVDADGLIQLGGGYSGDAAALCSVDSKYSRRIPADFVWNGQVRYETATRAGRTTFVLGILNILDRTPPRIYSNGTFGSDPMMYDFIGRSFYVRLSHRI